MKRNLWGVCLIYACLCFREYSAECPEIVSKDNWNGRPAVGVQYAIIPLEYAIIHHTITPECNTTETCSKRMKSIQDYHMDVLGFQDIGYNFAVGGDGKIYEGAGWHKVGAHTRKYNAISMGFGFIGDFNRNTPNPQQLNAAKTFLECAVSRRELDEKYKLIGASQIRDAKSPGQALFDEIKSWGHFEKKPVKL